MKEQSITDKKVRRSLKQCQDILDAQEAFQGGFEVGEIVTHKLTGEKMLILKIWVNGLIGVRLQNYETKEFKPIELMKIAETT